MGFLKKIFNPKKMFGDLKPGDIVYQIVFKKIGRVNNISVKTTTIRDVTDYLNNTMAITIADGAMFEYVPCNINSLNKKLFINNDDVKKALREHVLN